MPCNLVVSSLMLLPCRQVSSIGYIGGDKNISITQQLSAVVEKHLGIPPARVYVNVRLAFALPQNSPTAATCVLHFGQGGTYPSCQPDDAYNSRGMFDYK